MRIVLCRIEFSFNVQNIHNFRDDWIDRDGGQQTIDFQCSSHMPTDDAENKSDEAVGEGKNGMNEQHKTDDWEY